MLPDARCAANRTPRRAARTATGLAALILCTGLSAAAVGEKAGTVVNAGLPVTTVWSALQNGGGGTASEQPWGIAIGPDGHPAITARTNNGDTIYVAKYNSANGAVLWSQTQVGGALTTPKSIAANAASDIIVVGHLASTTAGSWITRQFAAATGAAGWTQTFATTIFDQPTGVGIGPSNVVGVAGQTGTQTNFHTRGYSAAGSAAFTANEAASAGTRGHSVAFDTAGNAIVAGERNNGTNSDCYVVKYNGSGTKQWEAILTGNSAGTDRCFSVAVDGNNDVLAAGRLFQDNAGTPSADAAVIKLNGATGAEVWRRAINGAGSGTDQAFWIQRASNNDALITGYATNAAANRDIITARIAATTGAVVWQQLFNGTANLSDEGRSLALDSSGNVYVAGQTGTSSTGPNFTDHYTVKYDGGTGTLIWDAQYNGPAGRTDQATPQGAPAIVVSAPDQVYVVIDTQNAAGDQDTLTLKYTAAAPPSPSASIAVAPASVSEDGATNLTYTVTLSSVVPSATTVNITTGGSASSATDYTGGVTTLTIPANTASATITINPSVDGTVEVNETVILTVAPGTGYTVGSPASATGTILNDDVPTATIAVSPASVAEDGAPSLVYTVTLNQANPSAATSVNYTVGGTANNGTDYSAIASPLVIPANATTGIITVNPTADAVIEADETVILTLSAGTGYTVGLPSAATGTILNDDLPNLTINDVSVNEGNAGTTNFSFTVSLSAPAGPGGVTFDIATANGSATAGVDYVANTLTNQTIPASSSTYTFTVLVNGDALNEPSETFFVNVTNVVNAVVIDGQGVGSIVNDDPLPSLSINDMSIGEGDSGTVNAVFTVTLSAASGQTVQVNYATANDTANGADYNTASGTLTFTPGQTTRTITVQVIGDAVVEPDETYFVNLSGATNATISDNQGVGTITNDDAPILSIGDVSIAEGNSGTQVLSFTVTRNGTTASAVTFDFASADDTATAGSDYVTASGSGSIPAGGASGTTTIDVTINGDAVFENSESFFINLSNPGGATIGDGQAVGTITNDDSAPTLSINDVSITEGNSGTQNLVFTVTRTGLTALPASFTAATANGTATAPSDYLAALVGSTTIAAGGATGTTTLTATINGDAVVEPNETFVVNLSAPSNATIADNQGTGTISNDDTAGIVLTQSAGSTDVTEGGVTDSYTLVLTSQPTGNVSVALGPDAQVTASTSPVVFTSANWATPQVVSVTAVDDAAIEGPHTGSISHTVTSADAVYNNFAVANVVANITDNDLPTLAINDVSIAEGNSGTQTLTFTVTRTGATASAVGFNFATANDTATIADSDYAAASGTGTIPSGGASGTTTIAVSINGDATFENSENFFVNLSAPTNAVITDGQGVGTINNDDAAPTLSINDVSITEGNSGTQNLVFTVTRTGLTALPASFTAATANGTATAPSDYLAALVGSTTIAAGGATGTTTLTATINGDAVVEANETFVVNLSAPTSATIADNQGTGTISNDDTAGVVVTQSGGNTAVTEGGASDSYTVVLTSQPTANVSVALSGTQVSAAPTPVTFTPANWNVAQTVTVTAIDDAIAEGNHSGSVASTVSSGDPVYAGFAVAPVPVSITDNDVPGITVTQSGGTTVATEGGATDSYSVVLTSQPTANVVIALSGTQVTPAPTPLTFTSGNWNVAQTVTVTAIDDAVAEGAHTGSVATAVTSGDSSYNGFAVAPVSVSITDNDTAGVTITQTGTTDVTEGGATDSYTAVLTSQPTADVTITPSTTGEVSISPASRIFTAANWNVAQSFTVTATDDAIVEGAESATITHSSASGDANYQGATVASVSAAISDNDSATVQFAPISVSQSEASSPMAFTVSLSAPVQSGVTLTVNSAPGTATAADFSAISGGTVSFAANSTTNQTVNVTINNDALDEDDESYTLTLTGLTATGNVTLSAATATGTILDDDPTPTISVTSPSLDEGNSGTSVMNFVVSLNAVSGRDVTFTRATADGTATVANNDYVALSAATATIPAGSTSLTIPVTINGDTPYEGNESFALNITGVSNATPASISGTGTIIDDDQQPTTTTITGDTPDPTVVGQPYTVSASVVAQTTSPLGTLTISDGSASCTATLTAGAAPNSAMSCLLTSTSAGAKTLTASYTPASSAFAASSDTDTHQVNAAATTISVTGPARSRINQATSFSFALGVTLPGAGTPTGVVTLTSGAATCTATLPATSCNLTFTTLGARTVTASYASDGNYLSSTSSGAGNAQTLVYALSDLSISKTDGVGYYEPGDLLVYSVIVRNLGPDDAANIRVVDTIPAGLTDVVWSCDASGGGVCPASGGVGNLDVVLANLRVGALLNFTFFGNVAGSPLVIANTASIVLPADTTIDDPSLGNNSATDTDVIDFSFRDGFESPPVNAPTGSARIPALALARSLGDEAQVVLSLDDAQGEALRVYARLHDNSLQYALARRASNGTLRLEAWRSLPGEPTLSWSARAVATGWVMEAAELR